MRHPRFPPAGRLFINIAEMQPHVDTTARADCEVAPDTWRTERWVNRDGGELRGHDSEHGAAVWTEVDRAPGLGNLASGSMWLGMDSQLKWIISR